MPFMRSPISCCGSRQTLRVHGRFPVSAPMPPVFWHNNPLSCKIISYKPLLLQLYIPSQYEIVWRILALLTVIVIIFNRFTLKGASFRFQISLVGKLVGLGFACCLNSMNSTIVYGIEQSDEDLQCAFCLRCGFRLIR